MKQIWNFICVQEFSHPLFNQITVDTTCCDVSRNHQKHHVGNKVNKPAKIQFRIHFWYWDLKDTIDTLSTWWMVTDWPLVYFVSQHLGIIWNCSFVQIYLTLCHYIHDVWQIFEALKHGKFTNGQWGHPYHWIWNMHYDGTNNGQMMIRQHQYRQYAHLSDIIRMELS